MRVYQRGKAIPMEQVTWALLCQAHTLVTHDDPDTPLPDFRREVSEAVANLVEFCLGGRRFKARATHNG